jgi:Spy/CpxP family protein refolding chaperone
MTRRVYLYFGLTFLLGAVLGGVGVFYYGWHTGHWRSRFDRQQVVRDLTRDLQLTDQQVTQLNQIFDQSSKRYRELHKEAEPKFAAARDQTEREIRQILTPQQAEKFNQMVQKWRQRGH